MLFDNSNRTKACVLELFDKLLVTQHKKLLGSMNDSGCTIPERMCGNNLITLTIVGAVVSAVCVVGNGIILAAFITVKSLRKPSNVLLTNLALGDFLYGFIGFPIYVIPDFQHHLFCHSTFAYIRVFILHLVFTLSLNNIFVIACERFLGIEYPFFYKSHVTTATALILSTTSWTFGIVRSIVFCTFYFNHENVAISIELVVMVMLLSVTCIVYCRVYFVSRRHLRRDFEFGIRNQESRAQVVVMIGVVNALSWTPVIVIRVLNIMSIDVGNWLQASWLCPFAGTGLNLVIYTYRMRDYREAVKALLGRRNVVSPPVHTIELSVH